MDYQDNEGRWHDQPPTPPPKKQKIQWKYVTLTFFFTVPFWAIYEFCGPKACGGFFIMILICTAWFLEQMVGPPKTWTPSMQFMFDDEASGGDDD